MKVSNLFSKVVLCGILPLCLLCGGLPVLAYSGSAPKSKTTGANLRVMSYNVLVDNDESLGGWSWGRPLGDRGEKASACIDYYRPDVIGFQECNYKWHVSLKENLPDYKFVNADVPEQQYLEKPESLGKKDWMCTTLMYNTKTLKLLKNELIGYSVNYWGCIQRMRYASMAVFEIKATGERFTFFSTHLDAEQDAKGQQNRMTQIGELVEIIKRYKSDYGYPVIGTGDFNSKFVDDPLQYVVKNAGMTASANNLGGIDYVLFSTGIQSKYFTAVGDSDVLSASDHKPVFADLSVSNYRFATTQKATTTTTAKANSGKPTAIVKPGQSTAPQQDGVGTNTTAADVSSPTDAVVSPDGGEVDTEQPETAVPTGGEMLPETGGMPSVLTALLASLGVAGIGGLLLIALPVVGCLLVAAAFVVVLILILKKKKK